MLMTKRSSKRRERKRNKVNEAQWKGTEKKTQPTAMSSGDAREVWKENSPTYSARGRHEGIMEVLDILFLISFFFFFFFSKVFIQSPCGAVTCWTPICILTDLIDNRHPLMDRGKDRIHVFSSLSYLRLNTFVYIKIVEYFLVCRQT